MKTNEKLSDFTLYRFLLYLLPYWMLFILTYYYLFGAGQIGDPNEPIGVRFIHSLLSLIFFISFVYLYQSFSNVWSSFNRKYYREYSFFINLFLSLCVGGIWIFPIFFMMFYPFFALLKSLIGSLWIDYNNVVLSPLISMPWDYKWVNIEEIQYDTSSFYYSLFCFFIFLLSIPYWLKLRRKFLSENEHNNQ